MRIVFAFALLLAATVGFGQVSVGFHQSNLPFFNFGYEGRSRFVPELRVGIDNFFSETSLEGVVLYQLKRTEDAALYGGLGGRINGFSGLVVPFGANVYPFAKKAFGFHLELAPIIGESALLRGSGGIRYRFRRD
jgi:hypothetical protein